MDRRTLIAGTLGLFAAPCAAEAQQAKAVPRVAWLGNASVSLSGAALDAFRVGLRELGYVEDRTIVIESRFADGKPERIQGLVRELSSHEAGPQALRAVKQATVSVPVVTAIISDPVEEGLVASLARPGGNLTEAGLSESGSDGKAAGVVEGGDSESLARGGPVGADVWRLRARTGRNGGSGA